MSDKIPVAAPALVGNEAEYVVDCIESTWISSKGDYIDKFEDMVADFCGVGHAITCCNGTAALHLALEAFEIGQGDEVIVPDLTFVSTANAVRYCNANPVFVDVDPVTWTLDPEDLADVVSDDTAAIIPVHLYGHPADMNPVKDIAKDYDAVVIEDAAEAHGAKYREMQCGSIGDAAIFSFYGNKIITTGEGGMVVTDDNELAERVMRLKDLCMDPNRRYWFPEVGYNYRMTNIHAAIGCAQMEKINWHITQRRKIARWYHERLEDIEGITRPVELDWAEHAYWMYSILLENHLSRDVIRKELNSMGIGTRPFFHPMTSLPPYENIDSQTETSHWLAQQGLNLPTWAELERKDINHVCTALDQAIDNHQ